MGNAFTIDCCAERQPHVPNFGRLSGERRKGPCVNNCGCAVTWNVTDSTCCRSCTRKPGTDIFVHGPGCDQLPTRAVIYARWREQQRIREAQRFAQLQALSPPASPRSNGGGTPSSTLLHVNGGTPSSTLPHIATPTRILKPCPTDGCSYMVTWHATHCCETCAEGDDAEGRPEGRAEGDAKGGADGGAAVPGDGHGASCERVVMPVVPCPGVGCPFTITKQHATHCCSVCAEGGSRHHPQCDRALFAEQLFASEVRAVSRADSFRTVLRGVEPV